ncbi:GNAT family N-acetyltransferase [Calothrix sp. 336/3]|uniref:GNAT family N-acetyltransferase n=1 Tax=Calothrix sp. 336/3 TaxID=1337936 RepID=UPI0004E3B96D|nr:N-acetyltransferase [Calothrix sp. 336/3]AKG23308.1 acetyltransferase [Calothrix sp. 336/3]
MQLPIHKILKNGMKVELDSMQAQEEEVVRRLLNLIIIDGKTYPQSQPLSPREFSNYWLSGKAFVVRNMDDLPEYQAQEVLGGFFLKPNFPGRCSHIGNAGFIVQPRCRGQGIGRFMGEAMLEIASSLGYEAVMFNLVFATNTPSLRLWQSLGFEEIGCIPNAVKLFEGESTDAVMLYKKLN